MSGYPYTFGYGVPVSYGVPVQTRQAIVYQVQPTYHQPVVFAQARYVAPSLSGPQLISSTYEQVGGQTWSVQTFRDPTTGITFQKRTPGVFV
ncbi:MAG: hypothetical protein Barrevirus4_16 [Barrevirus sp.]|uniref:Uncharacterized protein n=1 Tax=Barrevirus sp. TaxID=2487763 RepID=A0A3G4ZPU8_9VIRU|nr:MAG: hypothetical protein Barrevirus4_16 [Barrevirus sp.]